MAMKLATRALLSLAIIGGICSAGAMLWPTGGAVLQTVSAEDAAVPAQVAVEGAAVETAVPQPVAAAVPLPVRVMEPDPDSRGLAPAPRGRVTVSHSGSIVAERLIGEGGVAQVPELEPGIYNFVTTSPNGMAIRTVPILNDGSIDVLTLNEIAAVDIPLYYSLIGKVSSGAGIARNAPAETNEFAVATEAQSAFRARVVTYTVFPLVKHPLVDADVFLVRGGTIVTQSVTDQDGVALFPAISPGLYSMLVISSKGVAAISVEVAGGQLHAANGDSTMQFVSMDETIETEVGTTPITQVPLDPLPPVVDPEEPLPPAAGGFGGGGTMGGVGGGGGGFGWGGALLGGLIGGLAGWAASEANDDDNNNVVSP